MLKSMDVPIIKQMKTIETIIELKVRLFTWK